MKTYSFLLTEGYGDKYLLKVIKHQSPSLYKSVKSGNTSVKRAIEWLGKQRTFRNVKGLLTDKVPVEIPMDGSYEQEYDAVMKELRKRHPRAYIDKIVKKNFWGVDNDKKSIWKPGVGYEPTYEYGNGKDQHATKKLAKDLDIGLDVDYARKKFGFGVYNKDVNDQFYNPLRRFDGF